MKPLILLHCVFGFATVVLGCDLAEKGIRDASAPTADVQPPKATADSIISHDF